MINVNCISVCEILIHIKLKFVIFSIHEMIWRLFFLWTNYRRYSDMNNVDRICIFKILVHVRFVMVNFSLFPFVIKFGAISVFNQIINTILVWSMWFCFLFSKFLTKLRLLPFFRFMTMFGAFSSFEQIIDTISLFHNKLSIEFLCD